MRNRKLKQTLLISASFLCFQPAFHVFAISNEFSTEERFVDESTFSIENNLEVEENKKDESVVFTFSNGEIQGTISEVIYVPFNSDRKTNNVIVKLSETARIETSFLKENFII